MDRIEKLEETVAHLGRMLDDMSDVAARQHRDIATLTRRVAMLMQREAGVWHFQELLRRDYARPAG